MFLIGPEKDYLASIRNIVRNMIPKIDFQLMSKSFLIIDINSMKVCNKLHLVPVLRFLEPGTVVKM